MPSFAVKPADIGHSDYGECSIIARKESIDPRASKDQKIYGGDAWTPTFPEVHYKTSDAAIQQIKQKVDELVGGTQIRQQLSRIGYDSKNIEDALIRSGGDIVQAFGGDEALRYAFLKDTGIDAQLQTKEEPIGRLSGHDDGIYKQIVEEYGLDGLREIREKGSSYYKEHPETVQRMLDIINGFYAETMGANYDHDLFDELGFGDYDRLTADAYKYARDGAKQTVDETELRRMLGEKVDRKAYEEWLNELFDGVVEKKGIRNEKDLFTSSGNRRSWDSLHADYTLANIVGVMKKEAQQGRSQLFSGAASVKGAALKTYSDVEAARAETGRLRHTEEEAEQQFDVFQEKCTEICQGMLENKRSEYVGMFEMADALAETLGKTKTRDGIARYLKKEFGNFYNIYDGIADDVYELYQIANNIQMQYFESKLYRGYPLDEAAAIVVPDSAKVELISALENAGANVVTYEAGNEEDRLSVVNSIEGAKFSISEDELQQVERMIDDGSGESIFKTGLLRSNEDLLTRVVRDRSKTQTENFKNCHPYSSYERGSNENLNKMFRRLFPKGTDFDYVDDEEIIKAADWMNNYPRKVLGRTTAARRFNELLSA